jgi:hypothetical protein
MGVAWMTVALGAKCTTEHSFGKAVPLFLVDVMAHARLKTFPEDAK